MSNLWIVTANASCAHFFSQSAASAPLEKVGDLGNDKSSLQTADTESDRLGQHAASKSVHNVGAPTQPSGYQPHQTPAEHNAEIFARSVCQYLLDGYQDGRFEKLVLIASPEFLGVLRALIDKPLSKIVVTEINKDYTRCGPKELLEHIKANSTAEVV